MNNTAVAEKDTTYLDGPKVSSEDQKWSGLSESDVLALFDKFPTLKKYTDLVKAPERPVLGREKEMRSLLASLSRAEVSNAFLIGDPGSGKTMLVQGASKRDANRIYLEVNLAKMASSEKAGEDGSLQMGVRIKELFDEAQRFRKKMLADVKRSSIELVLFMDEFHLIQQLSPAATQAIKPALADSGTRGIKVIAATTFQEYHEYVEHDQALTERLQRINISQPDSTIVIQILKSIAERHGVAEKIVDHSIYDLIVEYSDRYIPANSQPRKSVLLLDAMIGWNRSFNRPMDKLLLADVIYESAGVQVAFKVDGKKIRRDLKKRVLSQSFAIKMVEDRLQTAVADLHDPTRPMSSFLFTGPTGVGKSELTKALASMLFNDERFLIRFDMSEFGLATSLDRFREDLTNAVFNRSHAIILLDEIEKADTSITRLLLQVLDDGRLSNRDGRVVSFLNTYIVLTTNAGNEVYKDVANYAKDKDGSGGMKEYDKIIKRSLMQNESFPPELINRMDRIIPFQPLSEETHEKIMALKLQQLIDTVYQKHGVSLIIDEAVHKYLVYEDLDESTDAGGARGLVKRLNLEVTSAVSRYINTFPNVKRISVIVEGEMAYLNKKILKSKARIKVGTSSRG